MLKRVAVCDAVSSANVMCSDICIAMRICCFVDSFPDFSHISNRQTHVVQPRDNHALFPHRIKDGQLSN